MKTHLYLHLPALYSSLATLSLTALSLPHLMGRMCAIILCFSSEFIPISRHLPYLSIYTLVFFHKIFSAKLSVCLCWAEGAKKKVVDQSLMRHETPFGLAACSHP